MGMVRWRRARELGRACERAGSSMTLPTLTAIIVVAAIAYLLMFALLGWMLRNAPAGWEDSEGFHYGEPGDDQ